VGLRAKGAAQPHQWLLAGNLSLGGLFVRSSEPLPVGTHVTLELEARGQTLPFAEAEVVWHRNDPADEPGTLPGVGLRFEPLGAESRALVMHLLDQGGTSRTNGRSLQAGRNAMHAPAGLITDYLKTLPVAERPTAPAIEAIAEKVAFEPVDGPAEEQSVSSWVDEVAPLEEGIHVFRSKPVAVLSMPETQPSTLAKLGALPVERSLEITDKPVFTAPPDERAIEITDGSVLVAGPERRTPPPFRSDLSATPTEPRMPLTLDFSDADEPSGDPSQPMAFALSPPGVEPKLTARAVAAAPVAEAEDFAHTLSTDAAQQGAVEVTPRRSQARSGSRWGNALAGLALTGAVAGSLFFAYRGLQAANEPNLALLDRAPVAPPAEHGVVVNDDDELIEQSAAAPAAAPESVAQLTAAASQAASQLPSLKLAPTLTFPPFTVVAHLAPEAKPVEVAAAAEPKAEPMKAEPVKAEPVKAVKAEPVKVAKVDHEEISLPTGAARSVRVTGKGKSLEVEPQLSPGSSIEKVFTLAGPPRLVIDLNGSSPKGNKQPVAGRAGVSSVRMGARKGGTRLVLDLRSPATKVETTGNRIVVTQ
jgi:uncharacterized protein (TIGR02266 family)